MKEEQARLKRKLLLIFWANLIIILGLTIALVFEIGIDGKSLTQTDFMWERFSIIITMAVIPLSLRYFFVQYKKAAKDELASFLQKIDKLFCIRLFALDFVIVLNFIGYYIIGASNFIYMVGIIILAFSMCYPTESMIDPIDEENIKTNENKNLEL